VGALLLTVAFLATGGAYVSRDARVDHERAVERARYRFVIGADRSFDEVYPRAVFEKRVRKEIEEEKVLARSFGLDVSPQLLSAEYDRIEKTTKAPEQWEAIKGALKNDRRLVEEVFCRPLLVERALAARFAFDQKIHAGPHQKAREARAAFLAGQSPPGLAVVRLRRRPEPPPSTDEMLGKTQAEALGPRILGGPEKRASENEPLPTDPEMAAVLEKELTMPGDVTTILEERDRFEVFHLLEATGETWTVEAIRITKVDFDAWLERERRAVKRLSSREKP
jgi:hypothetical protein